MTTCKNCGLEFRARGFKESKLEGLCDACYAEHARLTKQFQTMFWKFGTARRNSRGKDSRFCAEIMVAPG
jgi:hypothetical protein